MQDCTQTLSAEHNCVLSRQTRVNIYSNLLMNIEKRTPFCYCLVTTQNKTIGGPFHDSWYTNKPCSSIPAVPVRRFHVLFVPTAVGTGTGVPAMVLCRSVVAVAG